MADPITSPGLSTVVVADPDPELAVALPVQHLFVMTAVRGGPLHFQVAEIPASTVQAHVGQGNRATVPGEPGPVEDQNRGVAGSRRSVPGLPAGPADAVLTCQAEVGTDWAGVWIGPIGRRAVPSRSLYDRP